MNEKTALSIRFVGNPNDAFPLGASAFPILCCDVINFRGDFGTPSEIKKKKNKDAESDHNSIFDKFTIIEYHFYSREKFYVEYTPIFMAGVNC